MDSKELLEILVLAEKQAEEEIMDESELRKIQDKISFVLKKEESPRKFFKRLG